VAWRKCFLSFNLCYCSQTPENFPFSRSSASGQKEDSLAIEFFNLDPSAPIDMEGLGESSETQIPSTLVVSPPLPGEETAAAPEDEAARSTAKAIATILVSSAQMYVMQTDLISTF
jgi:hypothetical protein